MNETETLTSKYRRGSNRFQVGHRLSNIFNSPLEIKVLVENLLCLQG